MVQRIPNYFKATMMHKLFRVETLCLAAVLIALISCNAHAQTREANLVPLAYVRSLSVIPASLVTPPDPSLPPAPPIAQKKQFTRWQAQKTAREATVKLRHAALVAFDKSFGSILAASPIQTTVLPAEESFDGIAATLNMAVRFNASESVSKDFSQAATAKLSTIAAMDKSDALLVLSIDRFGVNTGFQRSIWIRTCAWLYTLRRSGKSELLGPFYALGQASAGRKLIGKGFARDDDALIADAADVAAHRLKKALDTGRPPLFSEDSRYAVLPASLPMRMFKQYLASDQQDANTVSNPATTVIASASINRQRDVLFQPETSPACAPIDQGAVQDAMTCFSLLPKDLWKETGEPNLASMKAVATYLKCRYIFASRATDIDCVETSEVVKDGAEPKEGVAIRVDVEVEGLLYDVQEGKVVWKDRLSGGTVARTEYVRHKPRIRTDEQCISDAMRTAFAYLRSSFDEYKRKLDRQP